MEMRAQRPVSRQIVSASLLVAYALTPVPLRAEGPPAHPVSRAHTMRRVVVSIPDCKLAFIENDRVVRVYAVAVGADESPSPTGTFTIVNRITDPAYYHRGRVIPPGAANPLGTRWIGLDIKGIGIHGTDAPESIGSRRSHGCIRMRNRDVEELFERLRPGDLVELHGERTPEMAGLFVG